MAIALIGLLSFNAYSQDIDELEREIIQNFSTKDPSKYAWDIHNLINQDKVERAELYTLLAYHYHVLSSPYEFIHFLKLGYKKDKTSLLRGLELIDLRARERLAKDLEETIEDGTSSEKPYNIYGIICFSIGNYIKAEDGLINALELEPEDGYSSFLLGQIKLIRKEYISAISYFNSAETNGFIHYDLYKFRGIAKGSIEDYQGSINDYNIAIGLNDSIAEHYYLRGISKNFLNNRYSAISDFTQAITYDAQYASAYNYRGIVYTKLEEYGNAIFDFQKALSLEPKHPFTHNNLGLAMLRMGQGIEAEPIFTKAIEINPRHHHAYYNRAITYFLSNDYSKAIRDLNKSLRLNYDNPNAHFLYALSLIKSNRGKRLNRMAGKICSELEIASDMGHDKAEILLESICIKEEDYDDEEDLEDLLIDEEEYLFEDN